MNTSYNSLSEIQHTSTLENKLYTPVKKSCDRLRTSAVQTYLDTMFPQALAVPEQGKLLQSPESRLGR